MKKNKPFICNEFNRILEEHMKQEIIDLQKKLDLKEKHNNKIQSIYNQQLKLLKKQNEELIEKNNELTKLSDTYIKHKAFQMFQQLQSDQFHQNQNTMYLLAKINKLKQQKKEKDSMINALRSELTEQEQEFTDKEHIYLNKLRMIQQQNNDDIYIADDAVMRAQSVSSNNNNNNNRKRKMDLIDLTNESPEPIKKKRKIENNNTSSLIINIARNKRKSKKGMKIVYWTKEENDAVLRGYEKYKYHKQTWKSIKEDRKFGEILHRRAYDHIHSQYVNIQKRNKNKQR